MATVDPLIDYELTGDGARREYRILISNLETDDDALEALNAFAPVTITPFPSAFPDVSLTRELKDLKVTGAGGNSYRGVVNWNNAAAKDIADRPSDDEKNEELASGGFLYQFALTSGSVNTKTSINTVSSTPAAGEDAPDFDQAIGVDENGNAAGIDVPSPQMNFSIRLQLFSGEFTQAYYLTLAALIGKKNDAAFLGFAAGEILLESATTGETIIGDPTDITFNFRYSPNQTNLPVGGGIIVPAKKGWEALWVYYREKINDTTKNVETKAIAAYVENVIPDGNFTLLNP